jgi:hypothetical protein
MAARTIHLTVGWGPWPDEPFLDMLGEFCGMLGIKMVACKDRNVSRVLEGVEAGRMRVLLHLDMQADYEDADDRYARLGYAVEDAGGMVVNDPDPAKACQNKAIIHYQLERAGIAVPYTAVVRNWRPATFRLTAAQKDRLGRQFIVKPARGFGKVGVVRVRHGSVKEITQARKFDRGDDFLIQELVEPEWFGHHMGWFRVFCLLGEVIICWWDTTTQHYTPLTVADFTRFGLAPLVDMARGIASATSMRFFSTEIAVTGRGRNRRFLSIDYVNDPCDTTLQSHSHSGLPDAVARHMAEAFAQAAWRLAHAGPLETAPSVWFVE